ncbi:MAG TPA: efflux RND transporter periplasmic adaptor subunit [Rubellimicrobium sp.]|nr:efflux RND transporter periplasmic adaptor subunit [Rubellimicrobium sp.]
MTVSRRFVDPLRIISAVSLLSLAGLSVVPASAQEGAALASQTEPQAPAVTVVDAVQRDLLQMVSISGTLMPREEVLVHPETSGYPVTGLYVDVGDRVEVGQVIARLDDRALQSQLAQAEAEHARANAGMRQARSAIASSQASYTQVSQSLDRAKLLHENGTTTVASLDEATAQALTAEASLASAQDGFAVAAAQFQQAEAALDLARLNVSHAEIRAPVSGIISARSGQIGSISNSAGEPIFRIIRDGLVEVEAEVIETELGLVSVDDPVEVEVAGLGQVNGTVRQISPLVDPSSRLGTIRIALEAREGLRPGLFAGGWITVETRMALSVPATAVITDAQESYVLRVEDGVLERRPVTAGLLWQDWREIVSGLEPGDQVVARAGAFFGDGDQVRPVLAQDAPEVRE